MAEEQDTTMQIDTKILLAIQNTLGKVEEAVTTVKEDIAELKQNAKQQTQSMEAHQDAIRDDLQHQIDAVRDRVYALETKKEKTLVKWYDKLIDKLGWFVIISLLIIVFRFIGIPAELIALLR